MQTLKESCRAKLRQMFEGLRMQTQAMTFILVTDEFTLRILSSFMKMMELVNFGITAIQKLTLKRKRFQKIDAIYLLTESPDSLNRLLQDYPNEEDAQYSSVHVFFTTRISNATMDRIAQNTVLLSRIKTFKELNLEFICVTQNDFSIDIFPNPQSFKHLYSSSGNMYKAEEKSAIERLATLIVSIPKFYGVEILYSAGHVQSISERIAKGLELRLLDMFNEFDKSRSQNYDRKANRTTVVIIDRSYDPISPLIRDFHYLPMLADMKEITQFKASYTEGQANSKQLDLDESDNIYMKYRYRHIAELLTGVSQDFQEFLKTNSAAKLEKGEGENLNVTKLGQIMKKIPQYNDLKQRYCMHMKWMEELMDGYKQRGLQAVGELEQTMVTGVNPKGAREHDQVIFKNLMMHLSKEKNSDVKARLICIALAYLNIDKKERTDLEMMLAGLGPNYKNISRGLTFLTGGQIQQKGRQNKDNPNLILDRHCPKVEAALNDIIVRGGKADLRSIKINTDDKGIISDQQNMVRRKIGREDAQSDKPKLILYVVGGIGFNEIRCANKFSERFTVITGSNQLLTPSLYLKQLNAMNYQEAEL